MEPASGLTLGNCEYLREPAFLRVEPPYPFRNIYKSPQTPASTKATAAAVQSHAKAARVALAERREVVKLHHRSGRLGRSVGKRFGLLLRNIFEQCVASAALEDAPPTMSAMPKLERRLPPGSRHAITCFIFGTLGCVFASSSALRRHMQCSRESVGALCSPAPIAEQMAHG